MASPKYLGRVIHFKNRVIFDDYCSPKVIKLRSIPLSIITLSLFVPFPRWSELLVKNRLFYPPETYTIWGNPIGISSQSLGLENYRVSGPPHSTGCLAIVSNVLALGLYQRVLDRPTDGWNCALQSCAVPTRDKIVVYVRWRKLILIMKWAHNDTGGRKWQRQTNDLCSHTVHFSKRCSAWNGVVTESVLIEKTFYFVVCHCRRNGAPLRHNIGLVNHLSILIYHAGRTKRTKTSYW